MMRQTALFTPEELAELAAFDAQVDAEDIRSEEIKASRELDRRIKMDALDNHRKKLAEYQREYRAAKRRAAQVLAQEGNT